MNGDRWERLYLRLLRLAVQTAAAGLGLWIMYKAINSPEQKPWLYAAALAMMGLPAARIFESFIATVGRVLDGAKPTEKPQQDEIEPPKSRSSTRRK